jgi:hypothetical protein
VEDYRVSETFANLMDYCSADRYFEMKRMAKDLIGHDYALIKLKRSVPDVTFPKILMNFRETAILGQVALVYGYAA